MYDFEMVEVDNESTDTIYQCGDCNEPFSNISQLVIHCIDKHQPNSSALEIRTEHLPETSACSKQDVITLEDDVILDVDPIQKVLEESFAEIDPKQGVLHESCFIPDYEQDVLDASHVNNDTKSHLHQIPVKVSPQRSLLNGGKSSGKKVFSNESVVKTGRKQSLLDGRYVDATEPSPDILLLEDTNKDNEIYVTDAEYRDILLEVQEDERDVLDATHVNSTGHKGSILNVDNIGDTDMKTEKSRPTNSELSEQRVFCDVDNMPSIHHASQPESSGNNVIPSQHIADNDKIKVYYGSKLIYEVPPQKNQTLKVYQGSKLLFESSEKSETQSIIPGEIPPNDNQAKINPCFLRNGNSIENIPGKTTLYLTTNKKYILEFDNLKQFLESGVSAVTKFEDKSDQGYKKFKCDICDQLFSDANLLKIHQSLHKNGKLYQCNICNQSFNGMKLLKIHKTSHASASGKPHKCDMCDKSFFEIYSLKIHKASHSEDKPYKCDVCDASFFTLISLLVHKESHEIVRPYECNICDKTFASMSLMNVHRQTHISLNPESREQSLQRIIQQLNKDTKEELDLTEFDKLFGNKKNLTRYVKKGVYVREHSCKLCDKQFFKQFNLDQHMRAQHILNGKTVNKKQCKCTYCPEKFLSVSDMISHCMQVHGEKPYKCDVCGKTFSKRSRLPGHMRTHTGERPYKCDLCDKSYRCHTNLVVHKRKHTGEKPFLCEFCSARFICKEILVEHRRRHTGEKPFKCEVCNNTFMTSSRLLHHRRMHTGEKPFSCELCGKTFAFRSVLKSHTRTHTGEKPFPCKVCKKSFSQKGALISHMRLHTGEKPYGCEICGRAFTLQQALNYHMFIHTGEKPFKCTICEKLFTRKGALSKHMKNSHPSESPEHLSMSMPIGQISLQ